MHSSCKRFAYVDCLSYISAGPAVSLEGYPRYNPQWGTQLTEPKRTSSSVPTRREPSDRAKSVMTKPGTPAYKASAGTPKPPSRPRPDPTGVPHLGSECKTCVHILHSFVH